MKTVQPKRFIHVGTLCLMLLAVLCIAVGSALAQTTQPEGSDEDTIRNLREEIELLRKENEEQDFYIKALRKEVIELGEQVNHGANVVKPTDKPTTTPVVHAGKGGNTTQPAGSSKYDRL